MDDLSCPLVVRKKYANTYGKNSKYLKAIDICMTGSCGGGAGSAGGSGGSSVGGTGSSLLALLGSPPPFCTI